MTTTDPHGRRRWQAVSKVVVAFAGAGRSAVLAQAAASAARVLGASLSGLYVRDLALQDLAGFPFPATLGHAGVRPERLTSEAVERAWMREEARCRAALANAVGTAAWSFESVAGGLHAVLAQRLARATLVAISAEDRAADASLSTLVRGISGAAGAVLAVPSAAGERPQGPVLAIDDGDRAGAETIALADRIAVATGRPLAVLALGTPAAAHGIAGRARGIATSRDIAVHTWPAWRADEIAAPIARLAPSMIVGDFAGQPFADPEAAGRVIRRLAAPLLLISPESGEG